VRGLEASTATTLMTLPKVAEPSLLTDQVFTALRASIMNGDLPAGHRLRIRDIAAQVGTSVMPVREAIRRLEEAGLAERVPHKGAVVRSLSFRELAQVYDVRALLEVEAAKLGARNISADEVDRMRASYDGLCKAIDARETVAYLDLDEEVLTTLYEASGNPVLVSQIQGLWQKCRSYKLVGADAALEQEDSATLRVFQSRLLEAAAGNDATSAGKITKESLRIASSRIKQHLADESLA
jgi:DNA-binding GntR family transcriptional regulator